MNCFPGPMWPHGLRTTASIPSPRGQPSYRQDLLSVQAVAVQEEGVDRVPRTGGLHGSGRDIQEVLRPVQGIAKRLGSGLPLMGALTPNTGLDPNTGRMVKSRL